MISGARGFLKREGFIFDKRPNQLDKAFLKLFDAEGQALIEQIWWSIHTLSASPGQLYAVPKTLKQAHTLMSHDIPRYVMGMEWIARQVERLGPKSVLEVGCGTGVLLRYLNENFSEMRLHGIDGSSALVDVAPSHPAIRLEVGDYLSADGDASFDMVVCNFGFDPDRFEKSTSPHSAAEIGASKFCPGCSDDLALQLERYMAAWRRWGTPKAHLLLVGRIPYFGDLLAFIRAAESRGWWVEPNSFEVLKVRELDGLLSRYPALVFSSTPNGTSDECLLAVEELYRQT